MAAFEAAAPSEFARPVPKLEGELGGKEVADLDGIEIATRDATHSGGSAMYKSLLERVDAEIPTPDCPTCGKPMERHHKYGKSFSSRPGPVKVERMYTAAGTAGPASSPWTARLARRGGRPRRARRASWPTPWARTVSRRRPASCAIWPG